MDTRRYQVANSASGASDALEVDTSAGSRYSLAAVVSAGAVLTYKVQHTFDNPRDTTPTWFDHEFMVDKTINDDGNYVFPVRGIRVNVTAYTGGTVTLTVLQGT